jgi:hypothetical protein
LVMDISPRRVADGLAMPVQGQAAGIGPEAGGDVWAATQHGPTQCRVVDVLTVPAPPTGLALSADGEQLFVTCAASRSTVCIFDIKGDSEEVPVGRVPPRGGRTAPGGGTGPTTASKQHHRDAPRILATIPAGHTAMAPVLSPMARPSTSATASTMT